MSGLAIELWVSVLNRLPNVADATVAASTCSAALAALPHTRFNPFARVGRWPKGTVAEPASGVYDVTISPGQPLQTMVDACPPGGSVLLLQGVHQGPLRLKKDTDVFLFGRDAAIIEAARSSTSVLTGTAVKRVAVVGITLRFAAAAAAADAPSTAAVVRFVLSDHARLQACQITGGDIGVLFTGNDLAEMVDCTVSEMTAKGVGASLSTVTPNLDDVNVNDHLVLGGERERAGILRITNCTFNCSTSGRGIAASIVRPFPRRTDDEPPAVVLRGNRFKGFSNAVVLVSPELGRTAELRDNRFTDAAGAPTLGERNVSGAGRDLRLVIEAHAARMPLTSAKWAAFAARKDLVEPADTQCTSFDAEVRPGQSLSAAIADLSDRVPYNRGANILLLPGVHVGPVVINLDLCELPSLKLHGLGKATLWSATFPALTCERNDVSLLGIEVICDASRPLPQGPLGPRGKGVQEALGPLTPHSSAVCCMHSDMRMLACYARAKGGVAFGVEMGSPTLIGCELCDSEVGLVALMPMSNPNLTSSTVERNRTGVVLSYLATLTLDNASCVVDNGCLQGTERKASDGFGVFLVDNTCSTMTSTDSMVWGNTHGDFGGPGWEAKDQRMTDVENRVLGSRAWRRAHAQGVGSSSSNSIVEPALKDFHAIVVAGSPVSLQATLDACPPGSNILLMSGVHPGPITVSKPVRLFGRGEAIIRANDSDHVPVVRISATNVSLEGIAIVRSIGSAIGSAIGSRVAAISIEGPATGPSATTVKRPKTERDVRLQLCTFTAGSDADAVVVAGGRFVSISSCTLFGSDRGLMVASGHCAVNGSRIEDNRSAGVAVANEASVQLTLNEIFDHAQGAGVWLAPRASYGATRNNIRNCLKEIDRQT